MPTRAIIIGSIMLLSGSLVATSAFSAADDQLKQLEQRSAKAVSSGVEEYARERFDAVRESIAAAKAAIALGREKEVLQQIELAEARLNAAEAKAAEKEMAEKVAVRRSELKKAEALLERYRQGEEN